MGVVGQGLSPPMAGDARSGATRAFLMSWVTPHPLGTFKFIKGGEIYNNPPWQFEGVFAGVFAGGATPSRT